MKELEMSKLRNINPEGDQVEGETEMEPHTF